MLDTLAWGGWFGTAQDLALWGWNISRGKAWDVPLVRVDVHSGLRMAIVEASRKRVDAQSGLRKVGVEC